MGTGSAHRDAVGQQPMIRRSIVIGLLGGLVFVLASIYPTLVLYADPHSPIGDWRPVLRLLPIIASTVAGIVILGLTGCLAAMGSSASDTGEGFKAGVASGLVVGLMYYSLVLAPTAAVAASIELWKFTPTALRPYPPDPQAFEFTHQVTQSMFARLVICLTAGGLLGGIEGAIVGWRWPRGQRSDPSLLDVVDTPHPRRLWFRDRDEVWRAGILGGSIGGFVIWLSLTVIFFSNLKLEWPALEAVVRENMRLLSQVLFADALLNWLLPLFVLAVLGTGALAVLLLRDPPRRHLSRFQVVLIAGVVAAIMIFVAVLQMAYFGMGLSRYAALYVVLEGQTVDPAGELFVNPEIMALLTQFVRSPSGRAPFFYLAPVVIFAAVLLVVLFWIAPQAVFYGLTLPLIFRRPVDRAARTARAVHNQPASLLPRVYGLYTNDPQAVKVLPHLSFLLRDPPSAGVVAAYHTLGTRPSETGRAVALIRQSCTEHEEWRWRSEVGELYRILEEGLAARTLAQVIAIQPPPQEVTSTLPVLLARSCEGIGRILGELRKVERVDDLNTKQIFLNSAQAALLDLRRQTDRESLDCQACETLYPEIAPLHSLLDLWHGYMLTAMQDLQGRADLHATLLAPRTGFASRVRQCIVVTNQGLNVAQNIQLLVASGEGYQVVQGAEQQVDILGPGENRELEFWLAPEAPRRLRLSWHLTFDDAVDTGRQVQYADAMDLMQEQVTASGAPATSSFQRIFPIPFVTGTPLRSGEMFVGRQDVFEFVQEHLLGTYQNNVIVLHGQRRAGKTSILYRLQEIMSSSHVAVLVDMQGKAARGTADFLYALSDDIVYALENNGIFVELPERSEYERAPEFTFRSRFLRAAVEQLDSRNLLLMFDEFEELQRRVEDGRLEAEIFAFLRNLMQHEARLDFVFSGTHKLEELGAEYWSILFNIAAYKRITFLDDGEVYRLVTEPVAPYGMEYDPLAVERIVQVTAGHPYFVQVVCHEMVAYHNQVERNYMTVTCVDNVLERIIERGEAHFKYIWAGAGPEERQVMLALAGLLPDADAAANPSQLGEELGRKGFELADEAIFRALARLQAKDIVTRSGPQSSLYRFNIDLIRRWIGITRPSP